VVYAPKFEKRDMISLCIARGDEVFRDIEAILPEPKADDVITAGRLIGYRSFGKISFGKLQDASAIIQVMFSVQNCRIEIDGVEYESVDENEQPLSAFKIMEKLVDVGDFIGVKGELFRTHKGELTVFARSFVFLSKAIRSLPEKFHGLQDKESIYRQRYLDLISNEESYNRFILRSKFIKTLRDFYDQEGFVEIETPILGSSASGAAAKPFQTHHHDFDLDVYLRISPETSLKKATVGRFERVFEIAKDFRNEGSDPSHSQEFTMVEHYAVYWNYEKNMDFTQKMIHYLFEKLQLNPICQIPDRDGVMREVDFANGWTKVSYVDLILNDT